MLLMALACWWWLWLRWWYCSSSQQQDCIFLEKNKNLFASIFLGELIVFEIRGKVTFDLRVIFSLHFENNCEATNLPLLLLRPSQPWDEWDGHGGRRVKKSINHIISPQNFFSSFFYWWGQLDHHFFQTCPSKRQTAVRWVEWARWEASKKGQSLNYTLLPNSFFIYLPMRLAGPSYFFRTCPSKFLFITMNIMGNTLTLL